MFVVPGEPQSRCQVGRPAASGSASISMSSLSDYHSDAEIFVCIPFVPHTPLSSDCNQARARKGGHVGGNQTGTD